MAGCGVHWEQLVLIASGEGGGGRKGEREGEGGRGSFVATGRGGGHPPLPPPPPPPPPSLSPPPFLSSSSPPLQAKQSGIERVTLLKRKEEKEEKEEEMEEVTIYWETLFEGAQRVLKFWSQKDCDMLEVGCVVKKHT